MPGANYMGGKRNAAKARTKDINGRAERCHFVKQRFQILSRGLSGRQDPDDKLSGRIDQIDLAHAKRNAGSNSPARVLAIPKANWQPLTPSTKRPRCFGSSLSSSSSQGRSNPSKSSKVLEMLDTNEPVAIRATMKRIIDMPDLAGLSSCRSKYGSNHDGESRPVKRRPTSPNLYEVPSKKQKSFMADRHHWNPISPPARTLKPINRKTSTIDSNNTPSPGQARSVSQSWEHTDPQEILPRADVDHDLRKLSLNQALVDDTDIADRNEYTDSPDGFSARQDMVRPYYDSGFSELDFDAVEEIKSPSPFLNRLTHMSVSSDEDPIAFQRVQAHRSFGLSRFSHANCDQGGAGPSSESDGSMGFPSGPLFSRNGLKRNAHNPAFSVFKPDGDKYKADRSSGLSSSPIQSNNFIDQNCNVFARQHPAKVHMSASDTRSVSTYFSSASNLTEYDLTDHELMTDCGNARTPITWSLSPSPRSTSESHIPSNRENHDIARCQSLDNLSLAAGDHGPVADCSFLQFGDPWRALDKVLGLRPQHRTPSDDGQDPLEGLNANERTGLGHTLRGKSKSPPPESHSQSSGIAAPIFPLGVSDNWSSLAQETAAAHDSDDDHNLSDPDNPGSEITSPSGPPFTIIPQSPIPEREYYQGSATEDFLVERNYTPAHSATPAKSMTLADYIHTHKDDASLSPVFSPHSIGERRNTDLPQLPILTNETDVKFPPESPLLQNSIDPFPFTQSYACEGNQVFTGDPRHSSLPDEALHSTEADYKSGEKCIDRRGDQRTTPEAPMSVNPSGADVECVIIEGPDIFSGMFDDEED